MAVLDKLTEGLLRAISDFSGEFKGAYNIRSNGGCVERKSSKNISIENKKDNPGLDIRVKPGTRGEEVYIPACITQPGLEDLVYNDFFVGEGADVTIIAGCGIHTETGEPARHSGVHRFFLAKNSRVLYLEKHIGTGSEQTEKNIDPQTEIFLEEGACLEMDTSQLGGVDNTDRKTFAQLARGANLTVKERLLTNGSDTARTDFTVELNGEGCGVNLISRSVARGESRQSYRSTIIGNAPCYGHSECDAILSENGRVDASPRLQVNDPDAQLIHEAAIGKIAGEQIMKLRTLGLTEEEAEAAIIDGFLK